MLCPKCGEGKTRVLKTKAFNTHTERERLCVECDYVVSTKEVFVDDTDLNEALRWVQLFASSNEI